MDKDYIEQQYKLAVFDFKMAKDEDAQWNARRTLARLEHLGSLMYGFDFVEILRSRELSGIL